METAALTEQDREEFRLQLLAWFRLNARDLPWRQTRDPYRIWVSEVMLQQTRVATVIARYNQFIQRFPSLVSLALAREDEVLTLWSGLGYY
ncbi:MAG: A/G-specific adenine glycosylase, partial [Acidobacteriaceae bacterium]